MLQGPPILVLMQRLLQTPREFLFSPLFELSPTRKNLKNSIYLPALYSDLCFFISNEFANPEDLKFFKLENNSQNINLLNIYALAVYLLHFPFFQNKPFLKSKLQVLFEKKLVAYNEILKAEKFIIDSEKREEFCRFILYHLGYIPESETERYALERLTSLDSIERIKLISDARRAQIAREEAIREAIRKREAEEAASRMSGE